jgi:hypothetical protein
MKLPRQLLGFLSAGVVGVSSDPVPLVPAHVHNDYKHAHPLFDALDWGFGNMEADVYQIEGRLLVAHKRSDVKPERTLEKPYIDPLREWVHTRGDCVFCGGATISLLVDVKSEAAPTYAALHAVLANYADMLTVLSNGAATSGAITFIVSGNRARAEMSAQAVRYAAIDGRPDDLDSAASPSLVPLIGADWNSLFRSRWIELIPDADLQLLQQIVSRAHAQGRRLRFWNTSDRTDVRRSLLGAVVEVLGDENLTGLQDILFMQR